ncbi:Synaptotagmin 1 [Hondaea fermentalgiana]|uniref:Synaptotagmin 1 n=1 Tax=Hondaea fermentalgiana TaxID=2315210 RepID=A0A2R5GVE5_9STRA|nr:Synaptotagmin 1 [Hondaea fermentalgiana]|eukprot:GBG32623.1 Synaptotagmin 1 [Hondaea fermentalgiana]
MGGSGTLTLEAESATGLKKLEIFTRQDPYVVFSFRKDEQRTATHQDASTEPRWAQQGLDRKVSFKVNPSKHHDENVAVRVMNDNGTKKKHKLIGEANINIQDLIDAENSSLTVKLHNGSKKAGTLALRASFDPPAKAERSSARATEDAAETTSPSDTKSKQENSFIQVVALRAQQLKNVQIVLAQDPYVKVTARGGACVEPVTKRTRKASGKNPTWSKKHDNDLKLSVPGPPSEILFEVYDAENFFADRIIASKTLSLAQFAKECANAPSGEMQLDLLDAKGKSAGKLFVQASLSSDLAAVAGPRHRDEKKSPRHASREKSAAKEKAADAASPTTPPKENSDVNKDENGDDDDDDEEEQQRTKAVEINKADAKGKQSSQTDSLLPGKLTITIVEGIKLKKVQRIGEQDPYVIAELLPWELKTDKTKTMSGCNPKWTTGNVLALDFPGHPGADRTPELKFHVFDEEMLLKHRPIGKGVLSLQEIVAQQSVAGKEIIVQLQDAAYKDAGQLKVRIGFQRAVITSADHPSDIAPADIKEGMLNVTALSANLTRSVEILSKQDPFMEVSLFPWASELQQGRTKPVTNAGKQVAWTQDDHDADMPLYLPGAPEAGEKIALHVFVKDAETFLQSRLIGQATVDLGPHLAALMKPSSVPVHIQVNLQYEKKKKKFAPCGTCELALSFRPGPPPARKASKTASADSAPLQGPPRSDPIDLEKPHSIYFTVHKGTGLRNRAYMGKQDPYVKLSLGPYGIEAKTQPVLDGGSDVEWDSSLGNALQLNFPGRRPGELPFVKMEVFDMQKLKDRIIGTAVLDPTVFLRTEKDKLQGFEVALKVPGKPDNNAGTIVLDVHATERMERKQTRCGTLRVLIEEVTTSKKGDLFSDNDLYVQLSITPGLPARKPIRSSVLRNAGLAATLDEELHLPVFDFGGGGVGPDQASARLKLEIMDRDVYTSDDCLGVGHMNLGEVFADAAKAPGALRTGDSHEVTLLDRSGKRERGRIYLKVEFAPTKARGPALLEALASHTGVLRLWALEARNLKHVGGVLDRKQDPYLCGVIQHPGNPDPGEPSSWPKAQRTVTAVDAGTQCVWNSTIDLPHGEAERAFAASGQKPGFLHLAVRDEGNFTDTTIGTSTLDVADMLASLSKDADDAWVTLVDADGKKTGEVRLAIDFSPHAPDAKLALRNEFAYVPAGTLHLLVVELDGLSKRVAAKISGSISLHGCKKPQPDIKIAPTTRTSDGKAVWNLVSEIEWTPDRLNPDTEPLMDTPAITITLSGSSGKMFAPNHPLGTCTLPLHAFFSPDGLSIEKVVTLVKSGDHQDTFRTLKLVGIFALRDQRPSASVLAAMTMPAVADADSGPSASSVTQHGRRGSKPPPVSRSVPGRLHIRVLRGQDLKNMDTLGKQDPFVQGVLVPGGTKFQTATCMDGGRNPKWTPALNNRHTVLVADADVAHVQLACFDEDDLGSNDLIGKVWIPLRPIALSARRARAERTPPGAKVWWHKVVDLHDQRVLALATSVADSAKFDSCTKDAWRAYSTAEAAPDRRARLVRFYAQLAEDGILASAGDEAGIDHKADKLHAKHPDTEEANKELFTKLYKRFRPDEECPESYWKTPQASSATRPQQAADLEEETIARAINVAAPQVQQRFSDLHLDAASIDRRTLAQSLLVAMRNAGCQRLDRAAFEGLAKASALYMLNVSADRGMCDLAVAPRNTETDDVEAASTTSTDLKTDSNNDENVFHQTLWWTLRDKAGKAAGRLEIAVGFTEDWKPAPRQALPELLVAGKVSVEVERAEFTTDKDLFGKQDPFVSLQWHAGEAGRAIKAVQTKVCANASKAVVWNETLVLPYAPELAFDAAHFGQTPSILIHARDKDPIGSDLIGETRVPMLALARHPKCLFTRALPLINTREGQTTRAGTLFVKMCFVPDAADDEPEPSARESATAETIPPSISGGRLILHVREARGLKDVQWVGKMDPITSLRLWPTQQTSKTKVARDADRDPRWDETHTMDTEDLDFSLLDVSVTTNGKPIGAVEIPLCSIRGVAEIKDQWYPLVRASSRSVSRVGEIQLGIVLERDVDSGANDERAAAATAIKYIPGPGDLHIRVHRAIDLRDPSIIGKQDPYVELEGIDWRKPFKVKTNVDENAGSNPVFDFATSAVLEWGPADRKIPSLAIRIKDRGALRDASIFSTSLNLAPWLLGPGQVASMWIPTYGGGDHGGPYQVKPKHGALFLELQFIPHADYPGKPSSAFSRYLQKAIQAHPEGPRAGDVHVQVLAARNLIDVQTFGRQDPYVKLTLVSGGGKADAALHFSSAKTKAIDNGGSNPEWLEDLLLPYSEQKLGIEGAGSTPLLLVEAWDANIKLRGDVLIGRTILPVFPFILDQGQVADVWYPITNSAGRKTGEVHLGLQFRRIGEAKRDLPSEKPENTLNIIVLRGRNLYNAGDGPLGMGGAQDPRVMFDFVGHDRVVSTAVARDQGTEPVFEERLQLKGCIPNERGSRPRLRCTVVDEDVGSDDFIGSFEFELTKQIMGGEGVDPKPFEQWFQLTDRAGKEARGEVHLILKRGPFPGDNEETASASAGSDLASGRLYLNLESIRNLSDAAGKVPRRPFVRAISSSANGKRVALVDSATISHDKKGNQSEGGGSGGDFMFASGEHLVVPVSKTAQSTVSLGAYERKWSIRGKRASLIAEGFLPKLARLTESFSGKAQPLSIKLKPSSAAEGPILGILEAKATFVPRVAGQLRVHVESVANVSSQEILGGKNDLRVDLSLHNGDTSLTPEHTTTKSNAGASATWNEDISLLYSNVNETRLPSLLARVVDVDSLTSNDLCGTVEIPLLDVFLEALAGGADNVVRREVQVYAMDKGTGELRLGLEFFPDADIFERKRKQESKQMMELKRMWNILDANGDARLTKEELCKGFASVPDCASFLGVDPAIFSAEAIASGAADRAVGDLFAEMNTNDDDIVDFDEFRHFVESKPARDRQRKLELENRRQQEHEAHEANLRRLRELERERARVAQEELAQRRKAEAEERARELEEKHREHERARRLREEKLALESEKRAQEELARLQAEAENLAKEERERKVREKKRAGRVHHQRPQDVMLWRSRDVAEWIAGDLELPAYTARFVEAAVDGPLLVALTEDDLGGAQLGVRDPLHRRKILLRAARLYELHRELVTDTSQEDAKLRAKQKHDESRRQQIWRFEYGEKSALGNNLEALSPADPFDWYEKDGFGRPRRSSGIDANNHSRNIIGGGGDNDDSDDDEESFRLAMTEVRDHLVKKTGLEIASLAPCSSPELRRLRLKNGELVEATSPTAREIKALPQDYWFQDHEPWFAPERPGSHPPATGRQARAQAHRNEGFLGGRNIRRIPENATAAEVMQVLREGIHALGLLSRLKFQGAVATVLGIELSWTQFDRVFRIVSPPRGDGTDGTIQFDEFLSAFAKELFDNTKRGERDRQRRPSERNPQAASAHRPKDTVRSLRAQLFAICDTLVRNEITLQDLFHGFDRNGSEEISTAEFASMMRTLSQGSFSKGDIYNLLACMDADFDRRISMQEFLDFWLVIFTQWLQSDQGPRRGRAKPRAAPCKDLNTQISFVTDGYEL